MHYYDYTITPIKTVQGKHFRIFLNFFLEFFQIFWKFLNSSDFEVSNTNVSSTEFSNLWLIPNLFRTERGS